MLKVLTTGASLSAGTALDARRRFGAALKAARERKGVSLSHIAQSTKISTSVLEGLEGGNLSRWPPGLFRRTYFRDYAKAVGVPVEPVMAEFLELFTDDEPKGGVPQQVASAEPPPSVPASAPSTLDPSNRRRILAAAIDAGAVLAVSACSARIAGASMWATSAVIAFAYYSIGTTWFGASLGERCVKDRAGKRNEPSRQHSADERQNDPAPHAAEELPARRRRKRRRSDRPGVVHMRMVR